MKRLTPRTRKLVLALMAFALVLSLAGLAQAQNRGARSGGERPDREEMINRMIARLDLNEAQQEQMKQVHLEHREEAEAMHEQMRAAQERVDERIDAKQFDEAAIREAAGEFAQLQADFFVARAEMQQKIREILTPEQYEELTEMRNRHHGMMQRHSSGQKGGRPHHGGGNKPAPEDG